LRGSPGRHLKLTLMRSRRLELSTGAAELPTICSPSSRDGARGDGIWLSGQIARIGRAKTSAHRVAVHFRFASRCAGFEPSCSSVLQNPLYRGESRSSESKHFITRLMLGRGSNPAHGDAERVRVTTRCAEVFALPFWGVAGTSRTLCLSAISYDRKDY
jgi:hypothetical protein